MASVHRIVVWVLIVLLVVMAVGHLVLTILFYAGVNQQGYGFFLDYRWPAWLITILDVAAALALWVSIKRVEGTSPLGPALTLAAAIYLVGRMAWTVVVPVLSVVAVAGAVHRSRSVPE